MTISRPSSPTSPPSTPPPVEGGGAMGGMSGVVQASPSFETIRSMALNKEWQLSGIDGATPQTDYKITLTQTQINEERKDLRAISHIVINGTVHASRAAIRDTELFVNAPGEEVQPQTPEQHELRKINELLNDGMTVQNLSDNEMELQGEEGKLSFTALLYASLHEKLDKNAKADKIGQSAVRNTAINALCQAYAEGERPPVPSRETLLGNWQPKVINGNWGGNNVKYSISQKSDGSLQIERYCQGTLQAKGTLTLDETKISVTDVTAVPDVPTPQQLDPHNFRPELNNFLLGAEGSQGDWGIISHSENYLLLSLGGTDSIFLLRE